MWRRRRERGNLKREAVNEGESGVNLKMTGGEGEARGGGEKERSVQIRDERRKTRHECVKMLTERSRKRGIASERVQSGESDTADVQGGLSLSPRRSLRRSTSLPLRSPREADTSLHAFDPLTEGGMNRGVERGERAGKKRAAKGG